VASADAYGGVKIFDTGTGTTRWELEPQDSVEFMPSVTFAADGERVAWSSRGRGAFVLNLASAEFSGNTQPIELRGHGKAVTNLRFDLSGARLLTVSADSTAIVWDAESGTAIRTLRGHSAGLNSGRFGPDALVLTTADDGTARIWDGDTGAGIRTLHGGGDHVLAEFAHASAYAVTLAARGGPRVWPLDDLPALVIWEEDGGLPAASLNGDTMFVVRGFESTVAWNLRTRSQVTDAAVIAGIAAEVATDTLPVPDAIAGGGSVQGRDESAEGRTVLVGYRTAAVHYAGAGTEPFATPERDVEVSAVALAPNPELFAVAFGKDEDDETATIELWTRGAVRPMNLRASGSVKAVAFSPDGTRLATAGETVQLWDPRTRVLLEAFGDMSEDLVTTVAFSADSRYLIAGTEEGELRVWRVDVRSLVSTPSGSPVQVWPASDWRRTVAAIEQRTTACLTAPQRARFLGETDRVAAGGAARCRDESARAE
jgi:WD40 repeat protein